MLMPTTLPWNKHYMLSLTLFSLVVTLQYTAKPHPVGTTTPTPPGLSATVHQCNSATVLFRTTTTFGTLTTSLLHSTSTSRVRGKYPPFSRSKTLFGLRRCIWNNLMRSRDSASSSDDS